ncbi:bifunctional adenosylcobinamide kinase/adenosylcobinamide-phosphate guanylyltransferase [Palleronia pontilimi]|uniref:bifunctional adenosylcobinamide kinase/adenosylcobinamide-phosphate guanylyltransferase n=1 Tax=Palleronia pontilimi TaxID=1964209 RepID=UPI0034CDE94A
MPNLTFILGGAASGKSNYSESLAKRCDIPRIYLATAQAFDREMTQKIAAHRRSRAADGWVTIEEPLALADALGRAPGGALVLLDCLTLWLSNILLAERDIAAEIDALMPALVGRDAPLIVVSNEVGAGIVPETPLGRRFRTAQGGLNQAVAARAHLVVSVMAGLPLALKGQLP